MALLVTLQRTKLQCAPTKENGLVKNVHALSKLIKDACDDGDEVIILNMITVSAKVEYELGKAFEYVANNLGTEIETEDP